ncbi:MAG: NAD(P)-dependent oxidoreductase [Elusimicrobia bacterium]|nr:NAD(P)-dependent oxidoreductase [Elusimicrobiota bacterium]
MRRALITGVTGFLGRALARRLLGDGYELHALARPGRSGSLEDLAGRVRVHDYDGRYGAVETALEEAKPELVLHLAALAPIAHEPGQIDELLDADFALGCRLAEASWRRGTRVFINTGSFWQRRGGRAYDPVNLYAALKQACEDALCFYARATDMRVATLTVYDVYGPSDPRAKLLSQLEQARRQGRRLDLSPGRQKLHMVYIDDAVEAFIKAARALESKPALSGSTWAVRGLKPISVRSLVASYEKVAGPVPVRWGGRPYRAREVMRPWNGPLVPGWKPTVGLPEGLRRCLGS